MKQYFLSQKRPFLRLISRKFPLNHKFDAPSLVFSSVFICFNNYYFNHLKTMAEETKPIVSKEGTFDKLDIRLGRILSVELATDTSKPTYIIKADFGKFGTRTSLGRFTKHSTEELKGKLILGVLNLEPKIMGSTLSEFLCLGVQYPKADSGEATIVSPLADAKIGGKLF
jgi:tRNA-binding protein